MLDKGIADCSVLNDKIRRGEKPRDVPCPLAYHEAGEAMCRIDGRAISKMIVCPLDRQQVKEKPKKGIDKSEWLFK